MAEPPPPITAPVPATSLEYQRADLARKQRGSFVPSLICSMIVYAVLAGLMGVSLTKMEQVFKDFKAELPGMTKLMLAFGRWFREVGWWLLLPLFIGVPIALAQIPRRNPPSPRNRNWFLINMTIGAILLIGVFFALGALLPMVSLIQTVSAPKK